jgi:hypothetical protein
MIRSATKRTGYARGPEREARRSAGHVAPPKVLARRTLNDAVPELSTEKRAVALGCRVASRTFDAESASRLAVA